VSGDTFFNQLDADGVSCHSERIIPRGVQTDEVVGIVLLLRDVLARSLFASYHEDFTKLNQILDAYEPAANRIAITVGVGFVLERERVIRQQQEAIRELSTPVLQVRERLHLAHHRRHRPPAGQTADRATPQGDTHEPREGCGARHHWRPVHRLAGRQPPRSDGRSGAAAGGDCDRHGPVAHIAQTLVNIGVDLGKMNTVGDLQGGIEEAERLLGHKATPTREDAPQ